TVTDSDGLYAALAQAEGGDTIQLAGGDYGTLSLWEGSGFSVEFSSEVVITSIDPDNPATFSRMSLNGVSNLSLEGLEFDYTFESGQPKYARPFKVDNSNNIAIRNSTFDGDIASDTGTTADGYSNGIGLSVRKSEDITFENNEVSNFWMGVSMGGGTGYVVRNNDIHTIRSDGLTFTKVQDVLIEGNYIHDFRRNLEAGDHADMIQFWTYGNTEAITDVIIRNNTLDIGEGEHTQSIFMGNEAVDQGADSQMFYKNIAIEGNTILNGHLNGIVVGAANNLVVDGNVVLRDDGSVPERAELSTGTPIIRIDKESTNVTITNNASADIWGYLEQSDWTIANNLEVQDKDPLAPGYYDAKTFMKSENTDGIDGS
uniref:right-handed parallel beta-helix repeat-containing protein n=1 Tax=uncultured Shimia sp. TaxID=573152 RepID=UPI00262B3D6E